MNKELRKISDYLLLKSSYVHDIGLFHGKMGVVVALYAYANNYNDKILEDYAWDLLQQIYDTVYNDMPIGMEYGLAGIGYGTTLLRKYRYVDCDLDAILADIDAKIMERNPCRMTDYSVHTGLGGLLFYITKRQEISGSLLTIDRQYIEDLRIAMNNRDELIPNTSIIDILIEPSFSINDYIDKPIGIDGGSAYYILKDVLL